MPYPVSSTSASSVMVRALCLDIERRVHQASSNLPVPDGCRGKAVHAQSPPFPSLPVVPWFSPVLPSQHFPDPVHPPTVFLWPSVSKDAWDFVAACPTYAQHKSPKAPPTRFRRPLPVPLRTWSHISKNFVTGLPPSAGQTAILSVGDQDGPLHHPAQATIRPGSRLKPVQACSLACSP